MYCKKAEMLKENTDGTPDITFPIEDCDSWPVFLQLFQKLFASFSNLFAGGVGKKRIYLLNWH